MSDFENLLDSYDMLPSSENLQTDSTDSNSSALISLSSLIGLPLFSKCEVSAISAPVNQSDKADELKTLDARAEDDFTLI
jgi:hypothetical protein